MKSARKPDVALLLDRCTYGASAMGLADARSMGVDAWLAEQLQPPLHDTVDTQRLTDARLRLRYGGNADYVARDEMLPLATLDRPIEQVWVLADFKQPMAGAERSRPRQEVACATLLLAAHSRWQLREILVDFWHNHFNVYAMDAPVAVALPTYDRDVIRPHCLGNFRAFLESVASSTAMLYYLNNRSSRAGIANENYARELFELHTLGRDHYLNEYYSRWRDVPGALHGKPMGYIDQDVYEAARAFTGWTVEDGSGLGGGQSLPNTGRFAYVELWHDNYQKRVLAEDFDPFQKPQADGRHVLDLLAAHPGTASYVCGKLCRRFVGDTVPKSLLAGTVAVWQKHAADDDQIARTVEHILRSPEFAASAGQRVKRPVELAISFVRAAEIDFTPTDSFIAELDGSGQRLFGWAPPTGHPDERDYWLSSHIMRRRWSLLMGLAGNSWNTGLLPQHEGTASEVLRAWQTRLGLADDPARDSAILAGLNLMPTASIPAQKQQQVAAYLAMSPGFQPC